jgi:hypothetical protein
MTTGPWLGDATGRPDPEPEGQPQALALGDDNDVLYPPVNDDEEGVIIPPLVEGVPVNITVMVNGGGGVLDAWIDFNGNQSWTDPGEKIFGGFLPDGNHQIPVTVPVGSVVASTVGRFRISTAGGLMPEGRAENGEVEDHSVTIRFAPTIGDIPDGTIPESTSTSPLPFSVSDVETPAADLVVTGSSSNTTLIPNNGIVFDGVDGSRTVTVTPAPGQTGTATITVTVTDSDGATAQETFDVTVTPVEDPPQASDSWVATHIDVPYAFYSVDFNFDDPDPGDSLASVIITQRETVGSLKWFNGTSWTEVTLNQEISAADIDVGNLVFEPDPGEYGWPYDSFRFKVRDDSSAGLLSLSDYQMTIDVRPWIIDDGDPAPLYTETGSGFTVSTAQGAFGDHRISEANSGNTASWNFDHPNVPSGWYIARATWVHKGTTRASNATYNLDNGTSTKSVAVNQKGSPSGITEFGITWQELGVVKITQDGSRPELKVTLSDAGANGEVDADAIWLARAPGILMDDGDTGYSSPGFVRFTGQGLYGDVHYSGSNWGNTAEWSFAGLTPGDYQVAATWTTHRNRATNAQYRINGTHVATVNQERNPNDYVANDRLWEVLGEAAVGPAGTLSVTLTDIGANDYVIADAIRLEPVSTRVLDRPGEFMVVDNGDPEYSTTSGAVLWKGAGYQGDLHYMAGDGSGDQSTWTFAADPGIYQVAVTWTSHENRAPDVDYTITAGTNTVTVQDIYQRMPPSADIVEDGEPFQILVDDFEIPIGISTLEISVSDNASGYIIMDAALARVVSLTDAGAPGSPPNSAGGVAFQPFEPQELTMDELASTATLPATDGIEAAATDNEVRDALFARLNDNFDLRLELFAGDGSEDDPEDGDSEEELLWLLYEDG